MSTRLNEIASEIESAYLSKTALQIQGGASKTFYGRPISGQLLSVANHSGIIEYEPSELYIKAKNGTTLHEIENIISEKNQILPCEPPSFNSNATLGGAVASGLSGPRRAHAGSVRDCILGTQIINGKGELLHFGGKVMKNVAGYDASRLMCGALGTLGVITEITLRLLPKSEEELTIVLNLSAKAAIAKVNQWANSPLPISATFYDGQQLFIRLSGSHSSTSAALATIGGESHPSHVEFWQSVKNQTHPFFNTEKSIWRISVPPSTPELSISGDYVMEWNAGLRWYKSNLSDAELRKAVSDAGGHAILFKGNTANEKFHPIAQTTMNMHKNLKHVFDPASILNPGRMFAEF